MSIGAAWSMQYEVATPSDMRSGVTDRCLSADQCTSAWLVAAKAATECARSRDLHSCKQTYPACMHVPGNHAYSNAMHSHAHLTSCHDVPALTSHSFFGAALSNSSRQCFVAS
jgi:hypothetical protein